MIKVKCTLKRGANVTVAGKAIDTANEAVGAVVSIVEAFTHNDAFLGDLVRKTIIAELEKLAPKQDGYTADTVIVDELHKREE